MDPPNALVGCRRFTPETDDKSHPRSISLVKDKSGFGFTLRHFIVYPPTSISSGKNTKGTKEDPSIEATAQWKADYKNKPMDTIFIREVKENSPAHNAGLKKGDRIIAINNHPLSGKSYSDIIHLILKSGQTLRLLVVPKEDDILQLYFASSAYQPVHREHKQHKYLVPSFRPDTDQSNQLYRQSAYGTYPGRIHRKAKTSMEKEAEKRSEAKRAFMEACSGDVNKELNLSSPSHLACGYDTKTYHPPSPEKCIFESGCFSEDEGLFHLTKEIENDDVLGSTKVPVANLFYSMCHDQPVSNFAFSSEENLNYPIYMSDFDDIVHCDNMAESSITEALHHGTMMSGTVPSAYERPQYTGANHSCDRDSDYLCRNPTGYYSNSRLLSAEDGGPVYSNVQALSPSGATYPGERNSMASEYDFSENPNIPSINLVAQRRHAFESGNILTESMDRMKLYKSELSRMSHPNHVQIVSARTAEFETKSATVVDLGIQRTSEFSDQKENSALNHSQYSQEESFEFDSSLDHQNSNTTPTEDQLACVDDFTKLDMESDHVDFVSDATSVVHRRKTVPVSSDQDEECHIVRRISYLRATAGERMNVESDLSEEDETCDASSPNKEYRIQKLKSFFGEKTPKVKQALVPVEISDTNGCSNPESQEVSEEPKTVYGWVICKVVSLEGKRSSDRSWRHLWAILRNNILYLLKDRREPSKGTLTGDEHVINVKYSIAKAANDYIKRKHVLRLMLLNGTEYLVQTESHACMMEWLQALQIFTKEISDLPEWLKNTSVLEKAAAYEQQIQKGKSHGQHHNVRKLVFRHRHPSEHSTNMKTRRASQGDELALSKIGVLWRDRMVQGWKKVHGMNSHLPKGASFGVKLENAPPGVTNEHIPLLVEMCIQIVESRGLDSVGIYRVPGNNASVSVLTDLVNQGIDDDLIKDPRWNDVNIVSSLLKAFFRKLPEPLLTSYLYSKFIQASETDDPVKRLKAIKHVLYHLPVHYFATLRYLMYHLKRVVEHSGTNKMEARNLAIVFGPTLVRSTDNNMVAMVTDMPQQCYLIESMIVYVEWLFEDCGDMLPLEINAQDKRKTHPPSNIQSTALLRNINKLEATCQLRHRAKKKDPASYSKKRSGIIADDTDILGNPGGMHIPENFDPLLDTTENPSSNVDEEPCPEEDFGSCSSLNSKSKEDPPFPQSHNGPTGSELTGDESFGHRYNQLSAIAQEKIKNFEQETKALLRRDVQKPRASVGTPQVEWEQIEKEWQKAKLELEQEDLLDYLADDPSYLSCLLGRGQPSSLGDPLPSTKSAITMSSSSSSVTELTNLQGSAKSSSPSNFPYPSMSQSQITQSNRLGPLRGFEPCRTKEIPTSVSQPTLMSSLCDRTAPISSEEYSFTRKSLAESKHQARVGLGNESAAKSSEEYSLTRESLPESKYEARVGLEKDTLTKSSDEYSLTRKFLSESKQEAGEKAMASSSCDLKQSHPPS
ncbi:hypothetical protein JTE90_024249 [Oedothorax gibbosus]|uniref:Rho GTPase-activating protein 23 n=1 Tax=Oedothorax gibbosus TaxID=931172 RepID=A0AAV6TXL4_9ARAC|nr:hypothetical protein JTE90_024249 [Oedothorax gibbosus]